MIDLEIREQEVRRQLADLQVQRDSIAFQVDAAIMTAKNSKEWADGDWLSRARHAMRITGREMAELQKELGKIKEEKKKINVQRSEERTNQFEKQFFYNAKKILPAVLYEEVLNKTLIDVG